MVQICYNQAVIITELDDRSKIMTKIFATIDLGSNSFHLLIVKVDSQLRRRIVLRRKQKVQLRAGLDDQGNLTEIMQTQALACLSEFASDIKRCKVQHVSAVGTYTFRKIETGNQFLRLAQTSLGHPIRIVSGEEEARLIYVGAMSQKQLAARHLVIDIGGGSTELIIGEHGDMLGLASLEMGCVSFQKHYFADERLNETNLCNAIEGAKQLIAPIKMQFLRLGWEVSVGSSGTIKTIASILREAGWKNGKITLAGLRYLYNQLLDSNTVSEINLPGLRADRVNVLAGGLAILMALFIELEIQELQLSKGAIREGILQELIRELM